MNYLRRPCEGNALVMFCTILFSFSADKKPKIPIKKGNRVVLIDRERSLYMSPWV